MSCEAELHSLWGGKLWHGLQLEIRGAGGRNLRQTGQQGHLRLSAQPARAPQPVNSSPCTLGGTGGYSAAPARVVSA